MHWCLTNLKGNIPSLQHLHLDSPKPYTQTAVPPLQHHSAARSQLVDPNTWVFGAALSKVPPGRLRSRQKHPQPPSLTPTLACHHA